MPVSFDVNNYILLFLLFSWRKRGTVLVFQANSYSYTQLMLINDRSFTILFYIVFLIPFRLPSQILDHIKLWYHNVLYRMPELFCVYSNWSHHTLIHVSLNVLIHQRLMYWRCRVDFVQHVRLGQEISLHQLIVTTHLAVELEPLLKLRRHTLNITNRVHTSTEWEQQWHLMHLYAP